MAVSLTKLCEGSESERESVSVRGNVYFDNFALQNARDRVRLKIRVLRPDSVHIPFSAREWETAPLGCSGSGRRVETLSKKTTNPQIAQKNEASPCATLHKNIYPTKTQHVAGNGEPLGQSEF